MPVQYGEGILAEHRHARSAAVVFDTCHMGEFEFTGPGAVAALERLLTQRISTLRVGQARYGYLLRENGGTLDDVICFRLADERFLLVVNPADGIKKKWRGRFMGGSSTADYLDQVRGPIH